MGVYSHHQGEAMENYQSGAESGRQSCGVEGEGSQESESMKINKQFRAGRPYCLGKILALPVQDCPIASLSKQSRA